MILKGSVYHFEDTTQKVAYIFKVICEHMYIHDIASESKDT